MRFSHVHFGIRGLAPFYLALVALLTGPEYAVAEPPQIQFNRYIRQILSQN